jgi:transcriptional regulator with XRE-family HTH domain
MIDSYRMRTLRKMVGLSQLEVARELGVDMSTVHRWETGLSKIKNRVQGKFITLVNDPERVHWIKGLRTRVPRGRPFRSRKESNVGQEGI